MSIRTIPGKRFMDQRDPGEDLTYESLRLLAAPRAIVEPETVGLRELETASVATILAGADVGIQGTFIKQGTENVVARTTLEIAGGGSAVLTDATTDMVVIMEQPNTFIVFTGFVALVDAGGGLGPVPQLSVRAHNLHTSDHAVNDAVTIGFVCTAGPAQPQPKTPNTELTVTPSKTWLIPNEPVTAAGLNLTAAPTAVIPANSIGAIELNSTDLQRLASQYCGLRGVYILTGGSVAVASGATQTLGTVTITGAAVGDPVLIGQKQLVATGYANPLYIGVVSAPNTVTVQARGNQFGSVTVPNNTHLNVLVLQ
jgi:hypothetical protein